MTGPPARVAALFDLHVHSQFSPDGRGSLSDLVKRAHEKGIQGLIVSDHNTYRMAEHIRKSKEKDVLVVPGMEVTTDVGHCLAIGVQREVANRRTLIETLESIKDAGGVGVPSHPFRFFNGVGEENLKQARKELVALEVYNARDGEGSHNPRSDHLARHWGLGGTGGSDAHQIFEVGNGYTMFPEFPSSVDDVVSMIRKRKTWGSGTATPKSKMFFQNLKNVRLWARRGFRPM